MRSKFLNEPAVLVATIESVLLALVAFQLPGLDQNDAVAIMAVVSAGAGALAAWATRDTFLSLLGGFVKAVILLAVNYGLPWNEEQVGLVGIAVATVLGLFVRTQTSPVVHGSFKVPDNPNVTSLPKAA
jgi:hypothetical protein